MNTVNDIWRNVSALQKPLEKLLDPVFEAPLYDQLEEMARPDDLDQAQLLDVLYSLENQLNKVYDRITYLNSKVVLDGFLKKNNYGRYEVEKKGFDHIYSSGSPIEVLLEDSEGERYWVISRVEHNGEDYYIVADPSLKLSDLRVRVRK